jgi:hypothetical protein
MADVFAAGTGVLTVRLPAHVHLCVRNPLRQPVRLNVVAVYNPLPDVVYGECWHGWSESDDGKLAPEHELLPLGVRQDGPVAALFDVGPRRLFRPRAGVTGHPLVLSPRHVCNLVLIHPGDNVLLRGQVFNWWFRRDFQPPLTLPDGVHWARRDPTAFAADPGQLPAWLGTPDPTADPADMLPEAAVPFLEEVPDPRLAALTFLHLRVTVES